MQGLTPAALSFLLLLACGTTEPASSAGAPAQEPPAPTEPSPGESPPPQPLRACAAPLPKISCDEEKAAPAEEKDVHAFLREAAVPLRCGEGDDLAWDVRPLIELYGDQKMFMLGEVHGSNEIGVFSAIMMKALAERGLVTIVGSEVPMDYDWYLQAYVDGKDEPFAAEILDAYEPNDFTVTLTRTTRALNEKGAGLRVAAVDIPVSPRSAAKWLESVVKKLSAQQKATVIDALPTSFTEPEATSEELGKVDTFFQLIEDKKAELCAELPPADCEQLEILNLALWASAHATDRAGDEELWFSRREEVIYYNLRMAMRSANNRMYLHMGAAHTDKNAGTAGTRMAKEHPVTRNRVFSVAAAWGDGSVIHAGADKPLSANPRMIAAALTHAPEHPIFVSATRPNAACQANPLGDEPVEWAGLRRESHDGYIHFGQLTSAIRPKDSRFTLETPVLGAPAKQSERARQLRAFRINVLEKERAAAAAGTLRRLGSRR